MPRSEATLRASVLAVATFVSWSLLIGEALHAGAPRTGGPDYGALARGFGK